MTTLTLSIQLLKVSRGTAVALGGGTPSMQQIGQQAMQATHIAEQQQLQLSFSDLNGLHCLLHKVCDAP